MRNVSVQTTPTWPYYQPGMAEQTARREWPELVGKTGEEAKQVILATGGPGIKSVEIIPADSLVTTDFRLDRVRIFVDESGKVERTPIVG